MPHPNSKPKVIKICLHCGCTFEVHPYRADTANCCSLSCAASVRTGEQAIHWQGGPAEKVCQCCGKSYKVGKASADVSHYCSRACADASRPKGPDSHAWHGGKITLTCQYCHQPFLALRAHINRAKFCSKQCHNEARMNRVTLTCEHCGKEFIERQSKSDHKYCSLECRNEHTTGSGSSNWLGGSSFAPYPPTFNNVFKRMIRQRDNHTCQICGKRGKVVHHVDYIKSNTTPDNCITLCRSCHGKTNVNREYWQSYFS